MILHCTALYRIIWQHICTALYRNMLYRIVLFCISKHHTALYSTVLYHIVYTRTQIIKYLVDGVVWKWYAPAVAVCQTPKQVAVKEVLDWFLVTPQMNPFEPLLDGEFQPS